MKLNKMLTCIAVMLMTSTAAMAQGTPFKVESYTTYKSSNLYIKLTALDDVTLWKIKLNRGNCRIIDGDDNLYSNTNSYYGINGLERLKAGEEVEGEYYKLFNKRLSAYKVFYRLKGTELKMKYKNDNYWYSKGNYRKKFGEVVKLETNCKEILEVELDTDKGTLKFNINK